MYGLQGIHRVGRPAALDLKRTRLTAPSASRDAAAGTSRSRCSGPGILLGGLVRRDVRGHHHHPLKPELLVCLARDRQMPEVGRVERPAEDAYRSAARPAPRPLPAHGGPVAVNGLLNRGRARPPR